MPTPTTSHWNNRQGRRDRQALAVLVTEDGNVHRFIGSAIPGVCTVAIVGREKNGKWSNTTFAVTHRPTTSFVSWWEDWDTGEAWPQASWEAGFEWLASKAPGLSMAGFDRAIRQHWPKTAERWDAAAKAVDEFAVALPLEHAADTAGRLAAHAERVAALKAQAAEKAEQDRLNAPLTANPFANLKL